MALFPSNSSFFQAPITAPIQTLPYSITLQINLYSIEQFKAVEFEVQVNGLGFNHAARLAVISPILTELVRELFYDSFSLDFSTLKNSSYVGNHTNVTIENKSGYYTLVAMEHTKSEEIVQATKNWVIKQGYDYNVFDFASHTDIETYSPGNGVVKLG